MNSHIVLSFLLISMPEITTQSNNAFFEFVNNGNYIELFSIVVVAITTYFVTKYTILKPEKQKIKQQQLNSVYLPLFRLFHNLPENIAKAKALEYHRKISNILDKYYEFVFPGLHELNDELRSQILKNRDYISTLRIMKHQIDIDYDLLKKSLGYPSANFIDIFIRMTVKQRVLWILSWVNAFYILAPIIFCIPLSRILLNLRSSTPIVLGSVIYIFVFIILLKINLWVQTLKD